MGRGGNKEILLAKPGIENKEKDTFEVKARKIEITEHPNADLLELAVIDDYRAVVKKGEFKTGETVIYIPEAAILPEKIISDLGLEGRLAGGTEHNGKKLRNRVKAVRLRQVLSQGLVYKPDNMQLVAGKDYAEQLGISKWSPPIPRGMAGDVNPAPISSYTKIQNIKKYPNLFKPGEEVIFTEKLHGTCTVAALINGEFYVSSKGLSGKALALKRQLDQQGNDKNVYWAMAERYSLQEKLTKLSELTGDEQVYIFGETLGVQDLKYGQENGGLDFRAFDIKTGEAFLDYDQQQETLRDLELPAVPELYRGAYDKQLIEQLATGKETFTGKETHIREGGVLRPVKERYEEELGSRLILKVISPDYLLRKGDATEYE